MYQRTLPLGDNLDTLGSRVRSLVKLTGQVLHRKHHSSLQVHIFRGNIQLRLGKYSLYRIVKQLLGDVLCIVAVNHPDILKAGNIQKIPAVAEQCLGLVRQLRLLFHKYSVYQLNSSLLPALLRRCRGGSSNYQTGWFLSWHRLPG